MAESKSQTFRGKVTTNGDDLDDTSSGESTTLPDSGPTVSKPASDKPQWFLVKLTHRSMNGRIVFRSTSEKRAQAWLAAHYPRGSEAYLESPDGSLTHYEGERSGEHGADAEQWGEFDPESWNPPDQAAPPGQDEWSDKEG
jgi:hypothetical protein